VGELQLDMMGTLLRLKASVQICFSSSILWSQPIIHLNTTSPMMQPFVRTPWVPDTSTLV